MKPEPPVRKIRMRVSLCARLIALHCLSGACAFRACAGFPAGWRGGKVSFELALDAGALFRAALLGPTQLRAEKSLQLIQRWFSGMAIGAELRTPEHDVTHAVCCFSTHRINCLGEAYVT